MLFGATELIIVIILSFLPAIIVIGYFIWLGKKINRIAKAQEEHSQNMREIIKLMKEGQQE